MVVHSYRYIRSKTNPDEYLMAGYSNFDGQYNTNLYEEVRGRLPRDAVKESRLPLEKRLYKLWENWQPGKSPSDKLSVFRNIGVIIDVMNFTEGNLDLMDAAMVGFPPVLKGKILDEIVKG